MYWVPGDQIYEVFPFIYFSHNNINWVCYFTYHSHPAWKHAAPCLCWHSCTHFCYADVILPTFHSTPPPETLPLIMHWKQFAVGNYHINLQVFGLLEGTHMILVRICNLHTHSIRALDWGSRWEGKDLIGTSWETFLLRWWWVYGMSCSRKVVKAGYNNLGGTMAQR